MKSRGLAALAARSPTVGLILASAIRMEAGCREGWGENEDGGWRVEDGGRRGRAAEAALPGFPLCSFLCLGLLDVLGFAALGADGGGAFQFVLDWGGDVALEDPG